MTETCRTDGAIITSLSMDDLKAVFPDAGIVYSGGAIYSDSETNVLIWDGAGTTGRDKVIRINRNCPNIVDGQCKLGIACLGWNTNSK